MESSREQLIESFLSQASNQLTIHEQDELAWLVSLLFTEEFFGKNNLHLYYDREKQAAYFKRITDFIASHKKAKKCLALIISELIHDEGEEKPEKPELERVKSLDFFHWAEHKGYQVPQKVLEGLKWLIQRDYYRKQAEAEEKRMFPELSKNDFELLRKEPLWAMDKAVLYINGLNTKEAHGDIRRFIKSKPHIEKLCLYATQAYRAKKLPVVIDSLPDADKGNQNEPNYVLIEHCSVEPEEFIKFVKTLPLTFHILDEQPQQEPAPKNNKYELSTKDTNTLFKLIAGMATAGYGYNPTSSKNPATSDIQSDTGVTAKTAKKWIDKAIEVSRGLKDDGDD